jgi:phage/plasmid-associated DNA primase
VEGEAIDIGTYWLQSPERRQYDGIAFAPGRSIGGYFNTFQGWALEPHAGGSCARYQAFVQEVICAGDAEAFAYVWRWLAHLFQQPWAIPETALVLRSQPGAGKNTFVGPIGKLLGAHYLELSHVDQMVGRFSAHMADKLLVFANEAMWGGDKSAEGTFKALVTDKQSAIEGKHRDIVARANYKRVIIASNEGWAAPKGARDRRLVTLDVPPVRCGDRPYFDAIRAELKKGGMRRLLYELLQVDLTGFRTQDIPQRLKEAGWDMAVASMDTVAAWWMELLEQGYIQMRGDDEYSASTPFVWPESVRTDYLHAMYIKWCERYRKFHPVEKSRFGAALHKFGVTRSRPWVKEGDTKRKVPCYFLPKLPAARGLMQDEYDLPPTVWGDSDA